MKLKKWKFLFMNIILATIIIITMATINHKTYVEGPDFEFKILIIPVSLGILFGTTIGILSLKRTEYLEGIIREKTKELEYYATMDDMTNTYNRRMGLKILRNHFSLSKRHRNSLAVCFVDIDGLKPINDSFGHAKGDKLIRDISEMLRSSIRESDIVSRMGGDEFLIILPECGVESAKKVIRRLTEKIRTYNEVSQKSYRASVSFGISEFSGCDDRTVEDLLAEADNKMYVMKKGTKTTSIKSCTAQKKESKGFSVENRYQLLKLR